MSEIYIREQDLDLRKPRKIAVIGVGGIGSWIAVDFTIYGVKEIVLIDNDVVEIHNLNRMPYKRFHADTSEYKVYAITEILNELRDDINVIPINKRVEDMTSEEIEFLDNTDILFDCRDRKTPLPREILDKTRKVIALGYDGFRVTLHFNPDYEKLWGEPHGYTIIPSFLVPPQFLANIIVLLVTTNKIPDGEKIINIDLKSFAEKIVTGDI